MLPSSLVVDMHALSNATTTSETESELTALSGEDEVLAGTSV